MAGLVKDFGSLSSWATAGERERERDSTDTLTRALGQSQAQDTSATVLVSPRNSACYKRKKSLFFFKKLQLLSLTLGQRKNCLFF